MKNIFILSCKNLIDTPLEDSELFNGLKTGNRKAVKKIYSTYLPSVKTWVMHNSGTRQDAEDVFQESLEIILLKIDHLQSSLAALIMQLSKRRWIDRIRKRNTRQKVSNELGKRLEDREEMDTALEDKQREYNRFKLLERTFKQLSETCQQLLELSRKGKDTEEILNIMSFNSVNTMYRRKAACISRWSELIKATQLIE